MLEIKKNIKKKLETSCVERESAVTAAESWFICVSYDFHLSQDFLTSKENSEVQGG